MLLKEYSSEKEIDWGYLCVGVCTRGVVANVKRTKKCSHFITHRGHLAAKKLPADLKNVLNIARKIVNEIRSRPLNSRLFKPLRESTDSQHEHLLHTEKDEPFSVLLRSRNKTVFKRKELVECLLGEMLTSNLTHLADIFCHLNKPDTSPRVLHKYLCTEKQDRGTYKKMLGVWDSFVRKRDTEMCPTLKDF